jgi:hypothetical protein
MTAMKPGDRVRVVNLNRATHYQLGDKGTVMAGPRIGAAGAVFYVVAMDRDSTLATAGVFAADEIEVDV